MLGIPPPTPPALTLAILQGGCVLEFPTHGWRRRCGQGGRAGQSWPLLPAFLAHPVAQLGRGMVLQRPHSSWRRQLHFQVEQAFDAQPTLSRIPLDLPGFCRFPLHGNSQDLRPLQVVERSCLWPETGGAGGCVSWELNCMGSGVGQGGLHTAHFPVPGLDSPLFLRTPRFTLAIRHSPSPA